MLPDLAAEVEVTTHPFDKRERPMRGVIVQHGALLSKVRVTGGQVLTFWNAELAPITDKGSAATT